MPSEKPLSILTALPATCMVLAVALVLQGKIQAAETQPGPLEPAAAQAAFVLESGYAIQLVAAEPDVVDPVHFAFAPDGRLWVVEYSDYPNGPDPGMPGKSRIRVLSDADQNGRYENAVTFAEGLLFANSLMLWKDGVIVTTNGKILFLKDSNADGRADIQQEWFTGFITENPQLRCNHPTLGLDGWIYVANGLRGGAIVPGVDFPWEKPVPSPIEPLNISGMDFRFHPHTGHYEAVTGNGQFGLCFDDHGNRFVCSNRNPCKHIVIEDQLLRTDPDLHVEQVMEDVSPAAEKSQLFPISRTWTTSNLHANQFTAACGVTIFRGQDLSSLYGNNFTCEPTANLIHRDVLMPRGATFTSRPAQSGVEFLATTDEWFRPVNLGHGPTAALYIADMYRAVIEHPQFMPDELKNRPDLLLGLDRGRIWKITANEDSGSPGSSVPLDALKLADLVQQLAQPNAWRRDTAFRLLWERRDPEVIALLRKLLSRQPDVPATVQALWLLHLLGNLEASDLRAAMERNDSAITEQVVQLLRREIDNMSGLPANIQATYKQAMLPELGVLYSRLSNEVLPDRWQPEQGRASFNERLLFELLKALPPGEAAIHRLVNYADVLDHWGHDSYFRAVAMRQSGKHLSTLTSMVLQREVSGSHGYPEGRLKAIRDLCRLVGRRRDVADIDRVFERVFVSPPSESTLTEERRLLGRAQVLLGLSEGLPQARDLTQAVLQARVSIRDEVQRTIHQAAQYLLNDQAQPLPSSDLMRILAFDTDPKTRAALTVLLDRPQWAPLAVDILAELDDAGLTRELLNRFGRSTPSVRSRIIQALVTSSSRAQPLLDAIEDGRIGTMEIDPASAQRLVKSRDEKIRTRATAIFEKNRPADRAEVLAQYKSALSMPPDMPSGREVFARNCATCHKIGDLGVNVAPDISDSRVRTTEYLLTHILDPNLAIDNNYFAYTLVDIQGRIFTGVVDNETSTAITLKQPEGKIVTIPRQDVEEMKSSGKSLMPVGLEKNITVQQMADVIGFIKNWRYLDGQIPGVGQ